MLLVLIIFCTGHEFRVVILSVVRTHHSIDKDSVYKCGFYTEKRVLNTAFTRVQSLIITAAHPLSLITRGQMSCRLFWASYLSQSLSDEECDQLRKEFVKECQVGHVAGHWQSNKASRTLIKEGIRKPGSEEYYDQILDELANQSTDFKSKHNNPTQENSLTNAVRNVTDSSTVMSNTLSDSHSLISLTSSNVDTTVHRTSIFVSGLHSPYSNNFSPGHKQFCTIVINRRGESGYALVLDPIQEDFWLSDSSALNRSLRGDTVVIDKLTKKKGTVTANFSDHPKKYLVCYSDRRNRSLFIPIDKQYPKIESLQSVKENGLRIYDLIQNTFGVKKARPSKVESYLEVNT